jgi:hypothetical protein
VAASSTILCKCFELAPVKTTCRGSNPAFVVTRVDGLLSIEQGVPRQMDKKWTKDLGAGPMIVDHGPELDLYGGP